jgi:hypothetical protein
MKTVYEKLNKVREEFAQACVKKSGNNFHLGFAYFELSDILPLAQKFFRKHRLFSRFLTKVGEFGNQAVLTITDIDSQENLEFTSHILHPQVVSRGLSMIQEVGKEHTYLKRYLWMHALELIEEDQAEKTAGKPESKDADPELVKFAKTNNIDIKKLANYLRKDLDKLTEEDIEFAIDKKREAQK